MNVQLQRLNEAFHFEAKNENNNSIHLDSSVAGGGNGLGFSPMQLLLAGIGGCSAIDIISILQKQRQDLKDISVSVDGERAVATDKVPAVFEKIHIHYTLKGNLDKDKVQRAIDLSMNTYCSVSKMLEKTAAVTTSFEIIPN
jgi:putative redox protein